MKTYKWESLKEKAKKLAGATPEFRKGSFLLVCEASYCTLLPAIYDVLRSKNSPILDRVAEMNQELFAEVENIIDRWDIRQAKKLIDLFPSVVASKYKNASCVCEMDENGDWVVVFDR